MNGRANKTLSGRGKAAPLSLAVEIVEKTFYENTSTQIIGNNNPSLALT